MLYLTATFVLMTAGLTACGKDKNDTSVSAGTTTEKSSGKAPLVAGGIVAAVITIVAGIFIKKRKK